MKTALIVAAVVLAAGAAIASASAQGPRPSSHNNWPGMTSAPPPAPSQTAEVPAGWQGPRPSSERNWPGMTDPGTEHGNPAAAPHYVWQEGYSRHGKWVGSWVLVR